jgi:TATA-binding protein-associated factor
MGTFVRPVLIPGQRGFFRMRGGGGHAVSPKDTVETPNPSRASSPDLRLGKASSNGVVIKQEIAIKSEMVIVDPAAKIAQNIQKGGNVNVSKGVGKDLTPPSGVWAWQAILDWLVEQLAAPGWEPRHGAALALRDLLRQQGSACGTVRGVSHDLNSLRSQQCLLHVAQAILRTLILDRFGDFVGDQVVAPVREAAAQALGSVLKLMSRKSVSTVHAYLIDMIAQPWSVSDDGKRIGYAWEVRHAGLLGLMYEVAVRPDIVAGVEATKTHIHQDADVKIEEVEEDLLQRVIDAAMLG